MHYRFNYAAHSLLPRLLLPLLPALRPARIDGRRRRGPDCRVLRLRVLRGGVSRGRNGAGGRIRSEYYLYFPLLRTGPNRATTATAANSPRTTSARSWRLIATSPAPGRRRRRAGEQGGSPCTGRRGSRKEQVSTEPCLTCSSFIIHFQSGLLHVRTFVVSIWLLSVFARENISCIYFGATIPVDIDIHHFNFAPATYFVPSSIPPCARRRQVIVVLLGH